MSDWFEPYRYIDNELREGPTFLSLEALAADLNDWRRAQACRSVTCTTTGARWLNPDEPVAIVQVDLRKISGGPVVATRQCLTAGEEADELHAAIVGTHHNFQQQAVA